MTVLDDCSFKSLVFKRFDNVEFGEIFEVARIALSYPRTRVQIGDMMDLNDDHLKKLGANLRRFMNREEEE